MYQYLPEIIEINEDSDSDNDEENELCEGQGYNNASVTQSTDVVCDKVCCIDERRSTCQGIVKL